MYNAIKHMPLGSVSNRVITDCWLPFLPKVKYNTLFKSLSYIDLSTLKQPDLKRLAWSFAGSMDLLEKEIDIRPFVHLNIPNYFQQAIITKAYREVRISRYNKDGDKSRKLLPPFYLQFQLYSGPDAGYVIYKWFSQNYITHIAHNPDTGLGYSNKDGIKFANVRQLYGNYCSLRFAKKMDKDTEITVQCRDSHRKHNVDLYNKRMRKGFTCPFKYQHMCHVCPRGIKSCPVACHASDWKHTLCDNCQSKNWTDPDLGRICLLCLEQKGRSNNV